MNKIKNLIALAEKFESKYKDVDKEVVIEEHDVKPISYMAFSNLKTIIDNAKELLSMLNEDDDLPQWVDEQLAIAKSNINKSLEFVKSQKQE
jgi:hypothetical protein